MGHKRDETDEVYAKWADKVNALAHAFPRTESGIEIHLLKKISAPDEAWLISQLGRKIESAKEIGDRLGLPEEEVKERLEAAAKHGVVWVDDRRGFDRYRLAPFLLGFYEAQMDRMDHEFVHLFEQYMMLEGAQGILGPKPQMHRVMPAHQALKTELILPYEDVRALLRGAKHFWVVNCACRVEQDIAGNRKCDFPLRNCLQFRKEGDSLRWTEYGSETLESISQEEALAILYETEENGLVHCVHNNAQGLGYICNCCGCCCGLLRGVTDWGLEDSIAKANYYAEIDSSECIGCEICIDRCQVNAISMQDDVAVVDVSRCIGCGLCVTGCPSDAAHLHKKPDAELILPPADFKTWEEERLRNRGFTK